MAQAIKSEHRIRRHRKGCAKLGSTLRNIVDCFGALLCPTFEKNEAISSSPDPDSLYFGSNNLVIFVQVRGVLRSDA
jgi:hypothetical protein